MDASPPIVEHRNESAEELMKALRRSNDRWWPSDGTPCPWVFRGIGNADEWNLIPTAWRETGGLSDLRKSINDLNLGMPAFRSMGFRIDDTPSHRMLYEWSSAELEALYRFALLANEVGFPVSFETFKPEQSPLICRRLIGFKDFFEFSEQELEFFAQAQHHGIPTRLLDWSLSPWVAAFFAVRASRMEKFRRPIRVWALDTNALRHEDKNCNDFGPFKVAFHAPSRGNNKYLHSQAGVLTQVMNANAHFIEHRNWPSLEFIFSKWGGNRLILEGHRLEAMHVKRLEILLDREGINEAALMPSLDNVAQTVISRWSYT